MIGTISLATSLFFSLLAVMAYGYAMQVKAEQERAERWGRVSLFGSCLAAVIASIYLWVMILGDHFEIAYVASYSSKELPLMYKISAFWAGQQGSLLLWLLIHALASLCLCCRQHMKAAGLLVYALIESLLVILVLAKSPFVASVTAVQDGVGLNPLLQDPWMAVHPPVIFIGYALLAVPFAYAMGALLKDEDQKSWLEPARRWALFAWGFLGGASSSAATGPIRCSAGAATGAGTLSRTPRSCRGCSLALSSTSCTSPSGGRRRSPCCTSRSSSRSRSSSTARS